MNVKIIENLMIDNVKFKKIFLFSSKNKFFLLTDDGCSIILSKYYVSMLENKKGSKKLISKLIRHGFSHNFNNVCDMPKEVKPNFFIIELTNYCNLACLYCFRGEHKKLSMSYDTLNNVLDNLYNYLITNNINNFSIQPWGGEPLLEIEKILYIKKYFDDKKIKPMISIETNGILLNEQNVRLLIENNIHFGLSIDGIDKIQNFHRPFSNGEGSMSVLKDNILKIKNNYPEINLSSISVISKDSIPFIKESIDFLVNELGIISLKMNFVKENPFMDSKIIPLDEENIIKLYEQVIETGIEFYKKGIIFFENNIIQRLNNLLFRDNRNICISRGCMGGYKMVSVDVNGDVYNCELIGDETQKLCSIEDDLIESIKKSIKLGNKYFMEKSNNECLTCPWSVYCKGGCSSNFLNSPSDKNIDQYTCIVNKYLYPKLIELILNNTDYINALYFGIR